MHSRIKIPYCDETFRNTESHLLINDFLKPEPGPYKKILNNPNEMTLMQDRDSTFGRSQIS